MKINNYKELVVWQKSIKLVKLSYDLVKKLPHSEEYGLSSQIRRSSVAISSNIAEGFGRHNIKEYLQFLYISLASAFELETQFIISNEIYKLNIQNETSLLQEIIKMLYSLISKLKKIPKT